MIEFVDEWNEFVMATCERGHNGQIPPWASQSLRFLDNACNPVYTSRLSDEQFQVIIFISEIRVNWLNNHFSIYANLSIHSNCI
jgi:hypothetical protein